MDWKNHLRKLEDKIIKKTRNEELAEIERTQRKKEYLRACSQIVKSIFPRIEKVFNEFAIVLRLDKKWQKAIVRKRIEKTNAIIWIERYFETYCGRDTFHHAEEIIVKLSPPSHIVIRRIIGGQFTFLPRKLLDKYRVYESDDKLCETSIPVDDFTEEKLAQVLAEFFTPD